MGGRPWASAGDELAGALHEVRDAVASAAYPLALPSAARATGAAAGLLAQLDDYLLPRCLRADAPLLAVVGGATGAGKSTLVNSLIRSPISPAGVLRPTTRVPLLACHPADLEWFGERTLLPSLGRSFRPGEHDLQVVNAPGLDPGLALLDAPDIDSVVAANRDLSRELLAAADLWLFVTTAARYADAVPWRLLREARERGIAVATVLDRVPPDAGEQIAADYGGMLTAQGLGRAPLFVVNESTLDGYGLLPEGVVEPVRRWLTDVARPAGPVREVALRTLLGTVDAALPRVAELAVAADDQVEAISTLAATVRRAYAGAMSDVEAEVRAGAVLRGDVYARWLELLDSGDLRQALRMTDRGRGGDARSAGGDSARPGERLRAAIVTAAAGLVVEAGGLAAQGAQDGWRAEPPGRELLAAEPELGQGSPGFAEAAHDLARSWQGWVQAMARLAAPRVRARGRSAKTAAVVLLAMIAAVAPPVESVTAAGPAAQALRDVLAERAGRTLGDRARAEFLVRVGELFAAEVDRHLVALRRVRPDPGLGGRLRAAADRVRAARHAASLEAAA